MTVSAGLVASPVAPAEAQATPPVPMSVSPTTVTPAAAKHPVTMTLSRNNPIRGERISVKGTVRGSVVRSVVLQGMVCRRTSARVTRCVWKDLVASKTTRSGRYSITWAMTPPKTTLRVLAPARKVGAVTYRKVVSPAQKIRTTAQSARLSAPATTTAGTAFSAALAFAPARLGRPTRVEALVAGTWTTVASGTESASGASGVSVTFANAGTYTIRAVALAWKGAAAVSSASSSVTVTSGSPTPPDLGVPATVSTGGSHTCMLMSKGTVKCWGLLGGGSTSLPVAVSGLSGVTAIASGENHTCALLSTGKVKCWGSNGDWQLGNVTSDSDPTDDSSVPVDVVGLPAGVTAITANGNHTCALIGAAGTVYCWGNNSYGQIGNATTDSGTPVTQVVSGEEGSTTPITGVTAISAGTEHTCALTTGGGALCWGHNNAGQLGDGTQTDRPSAVAVVDDHGTAWTRFDSISAGGNQTCAIAYGNQPHCWGDNGSGQLGTEDTVSSSVPVPVRNGDGDPLDGLVTVSAGNRHTCGLTAGGEIFCWGDNNSGELGNGTTDNALFPVSVKEDGTIPLIDGTTISAGKFTTCVIVVGGTAKCWGSNWAGQLGNGTNFDTSLPVDVVTSG